MTPRPAFTYRANRPRGLKVRPASVPAHVYDRLTWRAILRSRARRAAGLWDGITDPRSRGAA